MVEHCFRAFVTRTPSYVALGDYGEEVDVAPTPDESSAGVTATGQRPPHLEGDIQAGFDRRNVLPCAIEFKRGRLNSRNQSRKATGDWRRGRNLSRGAAESGWKLYCHRG